MNPEIILKVMVETPMEEVINENELNDEIKKSPYNLVGLNYKVKDNSYAAELVANERMPYHVGLYNTVVKIISNSYITTVKSVLGKDVTQRMIKVKSYKTGLIYEVIFNESWIQD